VTGKNHGFASDSERINEERAIFVALAQPENGLIMAFLRSIESTLISLVVLLPESTVSAILQVEQTQAVYSPYWSFPWRADINFITNKKRCSYSTIG
jgi:hypothetical protein